MGRWETARRADGTMFQRWHPTGPDEAMPHWGPGTAIPGCPVCGAQYERTPVRRLAQDPAAAEVVRQMAEASPFGLVAREKGLDIWDGEGTPWRWTIQHDLEAHRAHVTGVDEPLQRPRRTSEGTESAERVLARLRAASDQAGL